MTVRRVCRLLHRQLAAVRNWTIWRGSLDNRKDILIIHFFSHRPHKHKTRTRMSYQNSPSSIDKENKIAVPLMLMTPSTPPPIATTTRLLQWRVALLVVGMLLLFDVLAGCGVVGRRPEESSSTTAAAGLVGHFAPCLPATDTFMGGSVTTWYGKHYAFETCYKLNLDDGPAYCWSKSYKAVNLFYQCIPNPKHGGWYALEYTSPNLCGPPCQDMYQARRKITTKL